MIPSLHYMIPLVILQSLRYLLSNAKPTNTNDAIPLLGYFSVSLF